MAVGSIVDQDKIVDVFGSLAYPVFVCNEPEQGHNATLLAAGLARGWLRRFRVLISDSL